MEDYSRGSGQKNSGTHKVRDPWGIMTLLLLIPGMAFLAFQVMFKENTVVAAQFWVISLIPIVLRLRAVWNGVEIDYDNRTLSVPGGGISANSPADYFKPAYIFQYFLRKTIGLDDIRSMQDSMTWKQNKDTGSMTYKYLLTITGKFGGIVLKYSDENKRDELYTLIREANQMGTPFVRS